MNLKQKRDTLKRNAGFDGTITLLGNTHNLGIPDADFRHEVYADTDAPVQEKKPAPKKEKLDMKALLEEAEIGDPSTPSTSAPAKKDDEGRAAEGTPSGAAEYDPAAPQMALPDLLRKIQENSRIRAARDATPCYTHNPHLLNHAVAGAPYTHSLCRRCAPRRKCRQHREMFTQQTSISLCPHSYMTLYWAVNDPDNRRCSWKLEIRDYWGRSEWEEREGRREHGGCRVYRPRERVERLVSRVLWDMRAEREPLRGNERVVRDELYALLGAWERANMLRVERQERRKEQERRAQEKLAETLRVIQEIKEKEEASKKRKRSVEEGEVVESVEVGHVNKKARAESLKPSSTQQPTPPKSSSPTPEPVKSATPQPESFPPAADVSPEPTVPSSLKSVLSTPEQTQLSPPTARISPPSSASNKLKRSMSSSPTPSAKKSKKVRWAEDIEASHDIEHPRIMSPVYIREEDKGRFSPVEVVGRDFEDEVDYEDGDLD
ncbi:hypothetical protein BU26DRAFT_602080 [Trematosphaeria pertusa]|uniref:Uncharacterized protein n=1 Tax=Trematosphaeria pertusa TaxID=390896 RepID=A0A6A6IY13_9PLEO|nr:uncharacterized protein BU26DRAFT_602080 [Trematosphaeria pertusa]KAF2254073.1 hypothetical protein BU26DRAFT_602080 [Trematosphaeria pertusa]